MSLWMVVQYGGAPAENHYTLFESEDEATEYVRDREAHGYSCGRLVELPGVCFELEGKP